MRRLGAVFAAGLALLGLAPLAAQQPVRPDTKPTFEVISVKPNRSGEFGGSSGVEPGGQFTVRNNTLRNVIRNAYQVQDFQIVGGPSWLDNDRFDVTAKAANPNAPLDEMRSMVQALLADRFRLVVHRETRDVPIYALVVAGSDGRLGPRLTRSAIDCAAIVEAARRGQPPAPLPNGITPCGTRRLPGRMIASSVTMADLARNLSNDAGRFTVDKTGLSGRFDLELEFRPDRLPPDGVLPPGLPAPPADAPSLFTAVQEQLGLKLESQRGPVEVLVIDSASQPSPD